MRGPRSVLVGMVLAVCLVWSPGPFAAPPLAGLPDRLSNQEFWRLSAEFSEPSGFFNSDNLVSNEDTFQFAIPALIRTVAPGGVYVGVGPDQNFTYIAALEPAVAFIPDIRRGNLHVHLVYKAIFALSADRREFLARLFSRVPPALPPGATAQELMSAFTAVSPDQRMYDLNLRAVLDYLARHRGAPIEDLDRDGVEFVMNSFFVAGPDLTFVSNGGFRRSTRYPTFAALQTGTDLTGAERAYLSSEARFRRVKGLQERNLIIPVVGNFAGPRTLMAIGSWVRERGGVVTAFYTSNVEQYLFQEGTWDRFRNNVASLPIDGTSTFIRACFNSCTSPVGARVVTLLDSIGRLLETASSGRIQGYWDVLTHSRSPEE